MDEEIINNVINVMFPFILQTEKIMLARYLILLVNIISIYFNIDILTLKRRMSENMYREYRWLLTIFLPHIKSDTKTIQTLSTLFTQKKKDVDINKEEPEYVHTTIQYSLYYGRNENYKEVELTQHFLDQNFYLFVETVKICSNKLCINWYDVLPLLQQNDSNKITIERQLENAFNNHTLADIDSSKDCNLTLTNDQIIENVKNKMNGIVMDDIYNIFANDLFYDIVPVKFLIYDIQCRMMIDAGIFEDNEIPLLFALLNVFTDTIPYCSNNYEWNQLTDFIKEKQEKKWEQFIKFVEMGEGDEDITPEGLKKLASGLIFSFENDYYKKKQKDVIGYFPILLEQQKGDEDEEEDDEVKFSGIEIKGIIPSLKSIKFMYMYDHLLISIQKFLHTFYGKEFFTYIKSNDDPNKYVLAIRSEPPCIDIITLGSPPNTTNIIVSYKNLYNFSKSLVHYVEDGKFKEYSKHWCSLNKEQKEEILKRLNGKYTNVTKWFNLHRYIKKRMHTWNERKIKEFNVNIYDGLMGKIAEILIRVMIKKGILSQFNPDKMYKTWNVNHTMKDELKDNWDKIKNGYYFMTNKKYETEKQLFDLKIEKNKNPWYALDSFNWISQIGFCHHFINNRVMFVTGGTGVGKSTQVPKLCLYYLRAIDYNNNGTVVCSQPRTIPTVNNAKRISQELGLYNEFVDTKQHKIIKQKEEIKEDIKEDIKEEDKTDCYVQYLSQEKKSQCSKKHFGHKLTIMTDGILVNSILTNIMYKKKYKNEADIVIVDEVHEHNKNMDLALTHLRTTMLLNNSIRVLLLSATLESDEQKYRRFYRIVNDNRKFPLNLNIKEKFIDRIVVDRRYNITQPDVQTLFKITDLYEPKKKVTDIIKQVKNTNGNILIFEAGEADIKRTINELKPVVSSDTLILPLFGRMNKDISQYISNIDQYNISEIKIEQDKIDDIVNFTDISVFKEGKHSYTRVIIVSTNIAEASVTLNNLRIIIDKGTERVNMYDYKTNGSILMDYNISEKSRIQRRGRVGRTADGTVYYLYNQGAMEKNKIQYKISQEDLMLLLLQLLKKQNDKNVLISYSPDDYINKNNFHDNIPESYQNIYKEQFMTTEILYSYYGVNELSHYENLVVETSFPIYETGYDYNKIYDSRGKFYLIHPEEPSIKRNIGGDIVGIEENAKYDIEYKKKREVGTIRSKKIETFVASLIDYSYVVHTSETYEKTLLGEQILNLQEKLKMFDNHNIVRLLLLGTQSSINHILRLCAFLNLNDFNILNYLTENSKMVLNTFNRYDNDSENLLDMLNNLHKYIKTKTNKENIVELKETQLTLFHDEEDENYIKYKYNNNLIIDENNHDIIIEDIKQECEEQLKDTKIQTSITEWCTKYHFNNDKINQYIKQHINIALNVNINKNIFDNAISSINSIYSKRYTLKESLILSYPKNIVKHISGTSLYTSIYFPLTYNCVGIETDYKKKYLATFVEKQYLYNYILYIGKNVEKSTITMIHYVSLNDLKVLNKILTKEKIQKIITIDDKNKSLFRAIVPALEKTKYNIVFELEDMF